MKKRKIKTVHIIFYSVIAIICIGAFQENTVIDVSESIISDSYGNVDTAFSMPCTLYSLPYGGCNMMYNNKSGHSNVAFGTKAFKEFSQREYNNSAIGYKALTKTNTNVGIPGDAIWIKEQPAK